MNVAEFHQKVEQVWQQIEEKIDDEGLSIDTEIQGAVCTLTFDDESQIIINKQEAMVRVMACQQIRRLPFRFP